MAGNVYNFKGYEDMETREIHCKECGAYLGEIAVGYMKTVQCYCGEVMSVEPEKPVSFGDTPCPAVA